MSDSNNTSKGFIDTDSPEEVTHKSNLCNSGAPFGEFQNSGTGDRDERGRWQAGNRGAFKHGLQSKEVLENLTETPDAHEQLAAHRREILKDLGGNVSRSIGRRPKGSGAKNSDDWTAVRRDLAT